MQNTVRRSELHRAFQLGWSLQHSIYYIRKFNHNIHTAIKSYSEGPNRTPLLPKLTCLLIIYLNFLREQWFCEHLLFFSLSFFPLLKKKARGDFSDFTCCLFFLLGEVASFDAPVTLRPVTRWTVVLHCGFFLHQLILPSLFILQPWQWCTKFKSRQSGFTGLTCSCSAKLSWCEGYWLQICVSLIMKSDKFPLTKTNVRRLSDEQYQSESGAMSRLLLPWPTQADEFHARSLIPLNHPLWNHITYNIYSSFLLIVWINSWSKTFSSAHWVSGYVRWLVSLLEAEEVIENVRKLESRTLQSAAVWWGCAQLVNDFDDKYR